MFKKILIANRGEITCRIIQTATKLNIITVAVYSAIDVNALHVQLANEAYYLGPAPSINSYLNRKRLIEIAQQARVDAIHPGYGFLAEDAEFAKQCQEAGIIFVGPSTDAIEMMGDKNLAKNIMAKAGVPVAPGYTQDDGDLAAFNTAANMIGFPLLVKASAGGGGKGMRKVLQSEQLASAIEGAKREAKAYFGDDRVFLEKWIQQARHIEVQIMADTQGNIIDLFDRDCSVQRRHQKIIEEAPAIHISSKTREKMAKTAIQAAQAIHYYGAGTIEFLVDHQENYYFMEMNTRLQVEHPATEMITGLDLVEWQLRIAAGEPLPYTKADLYAKGHAIEARIYAEDPANHFLPSSGTFIYYHMPASHPHQVRVDTGVKQGDSISTYYDPLIAKLIVWGKDRESAIRRLQHCLFNTQIVGVKTNIAFLLRLIEDPHFIANELHTSFIDQQQTHLLESTTEVSAQMIALACLGVLHQHQQSANQYARKSEDSYSPWFIRDSWRTLRTSPTSISLTTPQKNWQIDLRQQKEGMHQLRWEHYDFIACAKWHDDTSCIATLNQQQIKATVVSEHQQLHIFSQGQYQCFTLQDHNPRPQGTSHQEWGITAPMPGTLVQVLVTLNQFVNEGDSLMVMESMKMEHTVSAPHDGVIKSIFYQVGDRLNEGDAVVELVNRIHNEMP